jgi:hypothetical protein
MDGENLQILPETWPWIVDLGIFFFILFLCSSDRDVMFLHSISQVNDLVKIVLLYGPIWSCRQVCCPWRDKYSVVNSADRRHADLEKCSRKLRSVLWLSAVTEFTSVRSTQLLQWPIVIITIQKKSVHCSFPTDSVYHDDSRGGSQL